MSFQHPSDWTPLKDIDPPVEQYCVVLRDSPRAGQMLFTAWARRDDDGRIWWWSSLKSNLKTVWKHEPTKLFRAVKSSDYWLRLASPTEPPVYDGCPEIDADYASRVERARTRRVVGMRKKSRRRKA